MSDPQNDSWLNVIDSAYQPTQPETTVPDPRSLQPRPLWLRLSSTLVIVLSALIASLAMGLTL